MKKIFLIQIEITSGDSWFVDDGKPQYRKGAVITIPVSSNNAYNAERKFANKCCGSEYPCYRAISIVECDDFLFQHMVDLNPNPDTVKCSNCGKRTTLTISGYCKHCQC